MSTPASGLAYIVDAVRTPVGRRGGALSHVHPVDLAAFVIRELVQRASVAVDAIDDVIWGCTDQVGPQASNIARFALLGAGLPEEVPGVTIDRQCGSSQQALQFAVQAVASGTQDVVVVGGVQSMSRVPGGTASGLDLGPNSHPSDASSWIERYGTQRLHQFAGAELIADKWGLSRHDMEVYSLESHRRAVAASARGAFDDELIALDSLDRDEGPRADTSLEKMKALRPLSPEGRLTAAVSSQISDGASAALVVSHRALAQYGFTPRAVVTHVDVRGDDPRFMLTAPISATRRALERAGMALSDIEVFEVNEAFACVPMAWMAELDVDHDQVNINGGAIAIGHPIGASGTRLLATMLGVLAERDQTVGLQVMCEGGGLANVTIVERLS